jgi:hypothetical protein
LRLPEVRGAAVLSVLRFDSPAVDSSSMIDWMSAALKKSCIVVVC